MKNYNFNKRFDVFINKPNDLEMLPNYVGKKSI